MNRSTLRNAFVLGLVTLVIAPAVLTLSVLNFLSVDRTEAARKNWDATLGTWEEVMRRFPATEANTTALELERLSAPLGITISPRFTDRAKATREAEMDFKRLRREIFRSFPAKQLEHARRGAIDAPPAALLEFMQTHEAELRALRRHLVQGDAPAWESDLSKTVSAPIPNLLGQVNLHKLLISVALAQLHAGDRAGALESIHASFNLSRSLRDSPTLICQLSYISAVRLQVGALRHVRDLPASWIDRVEEHDIRQSFMTALQFEGWVWIHFDRAAMSSSGSTNLWASGNATNWLIDKASFAVRPYTTLCMADVSDRWRKGVARLEKVQTLCDRDLAEEGADLDIPIPRWNRLGSIIVPNLGNAIHRVARLELDRELLRLAVEADAARRSAGDWPGPGSAGGPSAHCPDDRWIYTPSADGLEIALSREVQWQGQMAPVLPHRILLD